MVGTANKIRIFAFATTYIALTVLMLVLATPQTPLILGLTGAVSAAAGYGAREIYRNRNAAE